MNKPVLKNNKKTGVPTQAVTAASDVIKPTGKGAVKRSKKSSVPANRIPSQNKSNRVNHSMLKRMK